MKVPIIDENDNVLGYKEKADLLPTDCHRCSAIWVTNARGDVLLAKRVMTKKTSPGVWSPPIAGTVEEGETYDSNVVKEAEEELGLKNIQPKKLFKKFRAGRHGHLTQWYALQIETPVEELKWSREEYDEARWFTRKEIEEGLKERPEEFNKCTPEMLANYG